MDVLQNFHFYGLEVGGYEITSPRPHLRFCEKTLRSGTKDTSPRSPFRLSFFQGLLPVRGSGVGHTSCVRLKIWVRPAVSKEDTFLSSRISFLEVYDRRPLGTRFGVLRRG